MNIRKLAQAADALWKLTKYGYLPAGQVFYLAQKKEALFNEINAYSQAANGLLKKYGSSEDGVRFSVSGEKNVAAYQAELAELDAQEVQTSFDTGRITLCVETVEKNDQGLPADRRLGFAADDWLSIVPLCRVVEKEE